MDLSGRLYLAFHSAAFAGVPVTMPASRQLRVLRSAGAIWLVDRLPRPTSATPSLRCVCAETTFEISGAAASADVWMMNCRRVCSFTEYPFDSQAHEIQAHEIEPMPK